MYLPGTAAVIDDEVFDPRVAAKADEVRVTVIRPIGPVALVPQQIGPAMVTRGRSLPCTSDPDLFFAESPQDVELAKTLCGGCPVRRGCLTGAIERREPWGVWGGHLFLRGEIVPRKRARGRPRKDEVAA
jgi:WhiB family redox-sensing transcriptional regulator